MEKKKKILQEGKKEKEKNITKGNNGKDFKAGKNKFLDWVIDNRLLILAFLIPAIFYIGVCIHMKITPFGKQSMMVVDSIHQYLPFFSDYYEKLTDTHEFLFSWNSAMGYNFITLWAYYLCSPFNLLIVFFPKNMMTTAFTLIIGLKICSMSWSFCYMCAKKIKDKHDVRILVFSLCYALSNFVIGYYWNTMWLDVLIMMPLVISAFDHMMEKKDPKWYILTLFMAICGNFYIGFMLCIFMVLWYLCYAHKNIKSFFTNGIRFALSSLLAAGIGAFMLLPAYKGLMLTGQADTEFPKASWYDNIFKLIVQHEYKCGAITNQSFDGGVNLFCGLLSIYLLVLYFFMKEFSIGQKIKRFLLLAFLMISFNNTALNYIWHGFHDQFGIPNRFAFLYIFVVLYMAFEVLMNYKNIPFYGYFIPLAVFGVLLIYNEVGTEIFTDKAILKMNMGIMLGYFVYFIFAAAFEWKEQVVCGILFIAVAAEMMTNAVYSWDKNGSVDLKYYFADEKKITYAVDKIQSEDKSWHREELSDNLLVDENTYYNLPSIGVFGSTANGNAVDLLGKIGFYTAANEFLYKGATPLTNSLFGVKYLYKRPTNYYDHGFDIYKNYKSIEVYKNPYALSVGYLTDPAIKTWQYDTGELDTNLNNLVSSLTGEEGSSVFTLLPDDFEPSSSNCETYKGNDYTYHYKRTVDGENIKMSLTYQVPTDQPIFINATGTNFETMDVYVNDQLVNSGRLFFQLLRLGNAKAGDTVRVDFNYNSSAADEEYITCKAYSFDEEAFQHVYDVLSKSQIKVSSHTSDNIKGSINAQNDGTVMTSIVSDPGWSVYVDGKKTEITPIGNAFIGFDVTKGKHKIEFKYFPQGLKEGIIISSISLILFVTYFVIQRKRKNDEKEETVVS